MNAKDFCNWFEGVLDMAEDADGAATFTPQQVEKIRDRLKSALNAKSGPDPLSNRPPGARC